MEVQEQLDWQFGIEPTSTHSGQLESDSIAKGKENSIQSSRDETSERAVPFPGDDHATITTLNNLALKHGPQQDSQTLPVSSNSLSTSTKSRKNLIPEPALARSRKRKSPEHSEIDIAPPSKHEADGVTNRAVTKDVSPQLTRPTDPLNFRKLLLKSRDNPSRNKFDLPYDDPMPKVLPRKVEKPTGQTKKGRGRPPKLIPETRRGRSPKLISETLPDLGGKPSKGTAPPKGAQEGPPGKNQTSDVSMTNGQRRKQNGGPSLSAQQNQDKASLPRTGKLRVTRPSNIVTTGDEDLKVTPKSPERTETSFREQRQTGLAGDPVPDPISVLESEEDAEDSNYAENEEGKSSDEDSDDQDSFPEADHNAKPSHDNVPEELDESNKENHFSGSEEVTDVSENEDSENELELEFFGGKDTWERVIEGAKEIGVSRQKGVVTSREKPKLATDIVQDLVTIVQELASLYREIGSWSDGDLNDETVEDELRDLRGELNEAIDEVSELNASGHEQSLTQDIYAHAIPSMVFMLRAALICRSRHYSKPDDIESLNEVVEIQAKIIRLCEEARQSKAQPNTKQPIRGPVARRILPYMRDLKERYFDRELASRSHLAWKQSMEADFLENYKNVCEQRKLQRERHHQQVLERRRLIFEQLKERPRARGSQPQQKSSVDEISKAHRRSHSTTSDQWTRKQNEDLIDRLLSEESRYLPGMSAVDL